MKIPKPSPLMMLFFRWFLEGLTFMPRHRKRTDKNQAGIVTELRCVGIQVIVTNFGQNHPDLLCGFADKWILLEVKQPDGNIDRGQLGFLADARGPVAVVCKAEGAILAVCNPSEHTLSNPQQHKIAAWLIRNPTQETLSVRKFFEMVAEI